jgi:uncharacterized membrane protein
MHDEEKLLSKLKKKGWKEEELEHARIILSQNDLSHHIISPIYDRILGWVVFMTIIISTIAIFLYMIPLIPFFPSWFTASTVAILAFCLGLAFDNALKNLTYLKKKHYLIYALIMPIMSLAILLGIYVYLYNSVNFSQEYVINGISYIVGFMLPHHLRLTKEASES